MADVLLMRNIRAFLYFAIGLLLGTVTVLAHAVITPTQQTAPVQWTYFNNVCGDSRHYNVEGSAADACSDLQQKAAPFIANCGSTANVTGSSLVTATVCRLTWRYSTNGGVSYGNDQRDFELGKGCRSGYTYDAATDTCKGPVACPNNSTQQGSTCVCNSPLVEKNGQCVAATCTSQATIGGVGYIPYTGNTGMACEGGCKAFFRPSGGACPSHTGVYNGTQSILCKGQWEFAGNGADDTCTEGGTTPAKTPVNPNKDSCAPGDGMMKIDGQTRCYSQTTGKEKPTAAPTTETKEQQKTTTNNPNGTTTVTNVTNNTTTGGSTTVTNVYGAGVDPSSPLAVPISTTTSTTGGGANGEAVKGNGEGDKDACEDDPERVGCKHLDEILGTVPAPENIPTEGINLSFNAAGGFERWLVLMPSEPAHHAQIERPKHYRFRLATDMHIR